MINTIACILRENMPVYLSLDIILSSKLTVSHLGTDYVRRQISFYVFAPLEATVKVLRHYGSNFWNLWSNSLNFWYFLCYPLAFQWTTFQHFTGTIRKGVVVTCWIDQNARGRVEWGARSKRDEGEGRKGADTSESFTAQRLR